MTSKCNKCGGDMWSGGCPYCPITTYQIPTSYVFIAGGKTESNETLRAQLAEAQTEIERLKALVCNRCNGTREADTGGVTPWGAPINGECPECWSIDQLKKQLQISEAKRAELWAALNKIIDDPGFEVEGNEAAVALRMNLIAHKALSQDKPKILDVVEAAEAVVNSYILDDLGSQHPVQKLNKSLDAWRGRE